MAKYFWALFEDSDEYREIDESYGLSEEPTDDELKAVAQELMRDYGDDEDDYIYIGEGAQIKAEDIAPDDEAEHFIESAEEKAYYKGLYAEDDPLLEPTKADIDALNKRIAAVFTDWVNSRCVMREWYSIEHPKKYYREAL